MAQTPGPGAVESVLPSWQQVAFRSAESIRSHPDFARAHDCLVDGLATLYGEDRRLIRGLSEYVRAVSFMVIVCHDAGSDPADPATFVTLSRLRRSLGAMGITDARRINDIVNGLELDGFLTRDVSPVDRRVLLLKPTEKMLAADREWLAVFHAPLALLYPDDPAFQAAMARDPAYQRAYRRVSLTTLDFADAVTRANPPIGYFLSHNLGIRILAVLAASVRGKSPPRTGPGFYTAAAERNGVSRTHVSNLLQGAADRGLVALSEPAGRFVEMLPALEAAFSQWIADSLSGVDLVSKLAARVAHSQ